MQFQLTEDQEALQEGIRSFCEGRFGFEAVPELEKQPFTREMWGELAEMGVFALRLSEEQGGVELGMAEAAIVFGELGRRLVPGPTIWSHLLAGHIEGVAGGDVVVGGLDQPHTTNIPVLVEYGRQLDALVVLRPDGVFRIAAAELVGDDVPTPLDPLTPLVCVPALPQGERIGDAQLAERLRLEGAFLTSAFMLGIAESTLDYAVDYAKKREQFDRPIAGFQAIKHFAADMLCRVEATRAVVYAAGCTLDDPSIGDTDRAVSAARVVAGDAAMQNSRKCIQIYGGMGYTWEMPPHYYLKRTFVLENAFGTGEDHCERVADRIQAFG
jgi:alkylation response protein AidB-like acyl-CoA dehydrogenase